MQVTFARQPVPLRKAPLLFSATPALSPQEVSARKHIPDLEHNLARLAALHTQRYFEQPALSGAGQGRFTVAPLNNGQLFVAYVAHHLKAIGKAPGHFDNRDLLEKPFDAMNGFTEPFIDGPDRRSDILKTESNVTNRREFWQNVMPEWEDEGLIASSRDEGFAWRKLTPLGVLAYHRLIQAGVR